MDATDLIINIFPTQSLQASEEQYPYLHSQITELQADTLLGLAFSEHEIWTRAEIRAYLHNQARELNRTVVLIWPNRLTVPDEGYFHHYKGIPCLHKKVKE